MNEDPEFDLKALLGLPDEDEEPEEETPFSLSVGIALGKAVEAMRAEGVIEVEEENIEALVAELKEAAVESRSMKRLLKRVVGTLVHSNRVEEVYGTDNELTAFVRRFFEAE